MFSRLDQLIVEFDRALRTTASVPVSISGRESPIAGATETDFTLSEAERRHSAGLMRVNHVGEVCAQALYHAQGLAARDPQLRREFERAADEEGDHLAWTATRLEQLRSHASLLNPFWYAGSFALGWCVGKAGDRVSLGFVVETERQVEQHLAGHLDRLPENDSVSRAIVGRMRQDEARHGEAARALGAMAMPRPIRWAMRTAARVMTATAYWI